MYDNYNYPPGADGPGAPWNQVSPSDADYDKAEDQVLEERLADFLADPSTEPEGPFSLHQLIGLAFGKHSADHERIFATLEIRERCLKQQGLDARVEELAQQNQVERGEALEAMREEHRSDL